jgi:hypothetical protein
MPVCVCVCVCVCVRVWCVGGEYGSVKSDKMDGLEV